MKAVVIPRFGGPDVLEVASLPDPVAGPGSVRVRVAAATVNPTDLGLRAGGRPPSTPPPYIPGMELAGVVDQVGAGVEDIHVGDQVVAIVVPTRPEGGAQAELVVVPAASTVLAPPGSDLIHAATLPMNGLTAWMALESARLAPGDVVAVTGSAGAVGGYAIQLAKHRGLTVVADAAAADEALVRGFGADVVVPRGPDVATAIRAAVPDGVTALLDASVQGAAVMGAIRDGGVYLPVRGFSGAAPRGIRVEPVMVTRHAGNRAALQELARLAGEGVMALRVAEALPPERAAYAHATLAAGGVRGRLVIVF
jgi:NADPH2:quinone reductase